MMRQAAGKLGIEEGEAIEARASVFERILRATRAMPWNLSVVNRISIDIHQARFLVGPVLKLGFLWFFLRVP